jgi:hypothetical protein
MENRPPSMAGSDIGCFAEILFYWENIAINLTA